MTKLYATVKFECLNIFDYHLELGKCQVFISAAVRDNSLFFKVDRIHNVETLCYESNNFKLLIHKDDPPLKNSIKSMTLELFYDT